jgi:cation transporter-like permease
MIGLGSLVMIVVYCLIALLVLGLLWYLIGYCESQFPGFPVGFKVLRIVFVIVVVLVIINMLLSFAGNPIVRWGP